MNAALEGNQGCGPDAGCTMLATPSCVSLSTDTGEMTEVAVASASVAVVEHAFSVVEAETCPVCGVSNASFRQGTAPIAVCQSDGTCGIVTVTPPSPSLGQGSFEWACDPGCDEEAYCEVDVPDVWEDCPGWPGYGTVIGPGHCISVTPAPPATACYNTAFCGFEQNCRSDAGALSVCEKRCPNLEPINCAADCQLQSDNHGCLICDCDAGCPPPPSDGGS